MALFCRFAVSKPAHPLINSRRHDARPSVRRGVRRSTPEQSYNLASRSRVIIARSGGIGNESLVYPPYSPTPTARSHEALRPNPPNPRRGAASPPAALGEKTPNLPLAPLVGIAENPDRFVAVQVERF